jgi:hypothetical protein
MAIPESLNDALPSLMFKKVLLLSAAPRAVNSLPSCLREVRQKCIRINTQAGEKQVGLFSLARTLKRNLPFYGVLVLGLVRSSEEMKRAVGVLQCKITLLFRLKKVTLRLSLNKPLRMLAPNTNEAHETFRVHISATLFC